MCNKTPLDRQLLSPASLMATSKSRMQGSTRARTNIDHWNTSASGNVYAAQARMQDGQGDLLDLADKINPPRQPRFLSTQRERIRESMERNKVCDEVPTGESNIVFSKLLRQGHKKELEDLGHRRFR